MLVERELCYYVGVTTFANSAGSIAIRDSCSVGSCSRSAIVNAMTIVARNTSDLVRSSASLVSISVAGAAGFVAQASALCRKGCNSTRGRIRHVGSSAPMTLAAGFCLAILNLQDCVGCP